MWQLLPLLPLKATGKRRHRRQLLQLQLRRLQEDVQPQRRLRRLHHVPRRRR